MSHTHERAPGTALTHEPQRTRPGRVTAGLWRPRSFSLTGALQKSSPRHQHPCPRCSTEKEDVMENASPTPFPPTHPPAFSRPPPNYSGVLIWGACRGAAACPSRRLLRHCAPQTPEPGKCRCPLRGRWTWCAALGGAPAHATRRDTGTDKTTLGRHKTRVTLLQ